MIMMHTPNVSLFKVKQESCKFQTHAIVAKQSEANNNPSKAFLLRSYRKAQHSMNGIHQNTKVDDRLVISP